MTEFTPKHSHDLPCPQRSHIPIRKGRFITWVCHCLWGLYALSALINSSRTLFSKDPTMCLYLGTVPWHTSLKVCCYTGEAKVNVPVLSFNQPWFQTLKKGWYSEGKKGTMFIIGTYLWNTGVYLIEFLGQFSIVLSIYASH